MCRVSATIKSAPRPHFSPHPNNPRSSAPLFTDLDLCSLLLCTVEDSGYTGFVGSPPDSHITLDSTVVLAPDQWRYCVSRRLGSSVCMTTTCARKLVSLHVAPAFVMKATCAYDGEFIDFSCEQCSPDSCAHCTPERMGEPHYSLLHVRKYRRHDPEPRERASMLSCLVSRRSTTSTSMHSSNSGPAGFFTLPATAL